MHRQRSLFLLCEKNARLKRTYERLVGAGHTSSTADGKDGNTKRECEGELRFVPLGLWPRVLLQLDEKPTLVYPLLRTEPELFCSVREIVVAANVCDCSVL